MMSANRFFVRLSTAAFLLAMIATFGLHLGRRSPGGERRRHEGDRPADRLVAPSCDLWQSGDGARLDSETARMSNG